MSGPLTGIRVVDLSAMLSGPWTADILGDQGAEVIKVEPQGVGDHVRALSNQVNGLAPMFVNINRSKLRQARNAPRFGGTPVGPPRGAPRLGEHNREILTEIGMGADEIARLRATGVVGVEHAEPDPEPADAATVLTRGA